MLTMIRSEKTQPSGLALRELPPLLYGKSHPYGIPFTGTGDEHGVTAVPRADLAAHHSHWLRSAQATLFAGGATSLADVPPRLGLANATGMATCGTYLLLRRLSVMVKKQ